MRNLLLAEYLTQQIPQLEIGENLFINNMPASCKQGFLIKEGYAGATIDGEIQALRKARIHGVVRGQSYERCYALIKQVSAAFSRQNEFVLGNMQVKSVRPLTEPIPFAESSGDNVEFAVNFSIVYVIVS